MTTDKPNFIIVNSSDIAKDKNLNLSPKYWIDKKNPYKIIDKLKIDIIATFNGREQEWFKCSVWRKALESEKALISYIIMQLDYPNDLIKLSLCWECDKKIVTKYKTIHDSVFYKNGKYYFEDGKLLK
jgi:hypothetical protein